MGETIKNNFANEMKLINNTITEYKNNFEKIMESSLKSENELKTLKKDNDNINKEIQEINNNFESYKTQTEIDLKSLISANKMVKLTNKQNVEDTIDNN